MNISTKYVLLTLFLLLSTSWAFCQSGYKVSASSGANIRKGPATTEAVLTKIPDGAQIKVVDKSNSSWYKVEYNGKTGYVASSLIKEDTKNTHKDTPTRENTQSRPTSEDKRSNASTSQKSTMATGDKKTADKKASSGAKKENRSASSNTNREYKWGIGLRLGEPSGISVKKYNAGSSAWEFNVGRSARWGYRYGDDDFYRYSKYADKNYYRYAGYAPGFTTSLQARYLLHKPINGMEGLDFYYGAGLQVRFTPITYRYYYNEGDWNNDDWWKNNYYYREDRVTDIDLGLDGILGLEYQFKNTPISMFLDANLFIELVDTPLFFSGQGGIGVRYNF